MLSFFCKSVGNVVFFSPQGDKSKLSSCDANRSLQAAGFMFRFSSLRQNKPQLSYALDASKWGFCFWEEHVCIGALVWVTLGISEQTEETCWVQTFGSTELMIHTSSRIPAARLKYFCTVDANLQSQMQHPPVTGALVSPLPPLVALLVSEMRCVVSFQRKFLWLCLKVRSTSGCMFQVLGGRTGVKVTLFFLLSFKWCLKCEIF